MPKVKWYRVLYRDMDDAQYFGAGLMCGECLAISPDDVAGEAEVDPGEFDSFPVQHCMDCCRDFDE